MPAFAIGRLSVAALIDGAMDASRALNLFGRLLWVCCDDALARE